MKIVGLAFLMLVALVIVTPANCWAQSISSNASTTQDPTIRDLLNEVKQLRIDIRRVAAGAYRAQTVVERFRLQQAQVNRLSLELSKLREQLSDTRSMRLVLKEKLSEATRRYESGIMPEAELAAIKTSLEQLNQHEPELAQRELQLSAELNQQQIVLEDLNKRLDELERDLATIGGTDNKPKEQP